MKYIVAGNYTRFAVTLTQKSGELITPYIPTEGDVVQISLYGARRFDYPNYEQASNVLSFEDNGCLQVGLYCLEVKITEANTHKLRCMYREQIRVVASNDDVPTDASFSDDDIQLIGQFDIAASVEITIDDELSLTSTNPVQNKVVTAALNDRLNKGWYWDFTRLHFQDATVELDIDGSIYAGTIGEEEEIATMTARIPCAGELDEEGEPLCGVMSVSDKTKLDALPTNSDLQTSLAGKADGISTQPNAGSVSIELKSGNTTLATAFILDAGASNNGLMSASDYSKLAGIATGATRVIVDSTFDTTSNNAISNRAVATALGDIDTILDNILGN